MMIAPWSVTHSPHHERSRIEQSAAKLSIRLLLPTGLCMLPAFVAIGVIPAVMSFL